MSLLQFFTREGPIAGLEVSDTSLRLALLEPSVKRDVDRQTPRIIFLAEEPLKDGVISGGKIQDRAVFVQALTRLMQKTRGRVRTIIASIPQDSVYAHVFTFPKTIGGEKLEATMQLTVGFQLPMKIEDVYLDWEKAGEGGENAVLLAAIPKPAIDVYLESFQAAKLGLVAIEFHALSIARILDADDGTTTLLAIRGSISTTVNILRGRTLGFSRTLPNTFVSVAALAEETRRISDFYEATRGPITRRLLREDTRITGFANNPEVAAEPDKWIIALGAAVRALIPRAEDHLISLLPIGTEEAYERQKAATFTAFLAHATVGLVMFFTAAFLGVWIFMASLQQRTSDRIENLRALPLPQDTTELEARAVHLNSLLGTMRAVVDRSPRWSVMVEELRTRVVPGITVTEVSLPSTDGQFTIKGIALNRMQLNLLKKSLAESPLFAEVTLPLTNLEARESIPFAISFRLKEPPQIMGGQASTNP